MITYNNRNHIPFPTESRDLELGSMSENAPYQVQVQHLLDCIQARDDFVASWLPSSGQHYLAWMMVAVFGTGSALCGAGTVVSLGLGVRWLVQEEVGWQDGLIASVLGITLIPLGGGRVTKMFYDMAKMAHRKIARENRELLRALQQRVAKAADLFANGAPDDVFQRVLEEFNVRPGELLSALDVHHPRAGTVMQHIADHNLWHELDLVFSSHAKDVHIAMGNMLLDTMAHPAEFLKRLDQASDPEHLLAVACFSGQAALEEVDVTIRAYLCEHPDVAQKAAVRVMLLCSRFGMDHYAMAIKNGRVMGLPLAIRNIALRIDLPL